MPDQSVETDFVAFLSQERATIKEAQEVAAAAIQAVTDREDEFLEKLRRLLVGKVVRVNCTLESEEIMTQDSFEYVSSYAYLRNEPIYITGVYKAKDRLGENHLVIYGQYEEAYRKNQRGGGLAFLLEGISKLTFPN